MNIKYILTHPIQYQVPLIKFLVKKKFNITVLYRSNYSIKKHYDHGFKKKITWKTNLLNGYNYRFLDYLGKNKVSFFLPFTTDFYKGILDKNTDIIWVHGVKIWYNILIVILANIFNKKVFVRDEVHSNSKFRNSLNIFLNKIFYKILDPFIDIYLAIGKKNKEYYLTNKISKNKIVMMPYVVNNDLFSIKKRIKNKKIKILYAGKLIKRKGVDILLKSILHIKNNYNLVNKFELMIVGDGHMRDYLVNYIKLKKLTNIKIISFKNEKELSKIYQKSDIFIMPSYFEPWGLTINEALASENAIICSNKVGSSYDLVHQGKNGYLFKEKSYKSLASKIIKLVENKKRINLFKKESLKIISKWSFNECQFGLKKAINKINQLS
jgi:glycosyltransferase involved in cell wall biosynthesis